jgi:metal-dependent amidase/aminoacylase/carboxypeptidase family protein
MACRAVLPTEQSGVSWIVAGTPAEESYGGKIAMADAGLFGGVDAALLAHPGMRNGIGGTSWASHPVELTFRGKPSHAGGNPQEGINALDACVQAYIMIRNLRNQLRDDVRLAGVITHGGDVQNVIPELARMRFTVRSKEWRFIEETLIPRVVGCARAAAEANMATLEWRHHELLFKECLAHPVLQRLALKYFEEMGEVVPPPPEGAGGGTTDVGAVTWACPALQISYRITDARGHSREMADATLTPYAIDQTLKAAKVMAFTAAELAQSPVLIAEAGRHLQESG